MSLHSATHIKPSTVVPRWSLTATVQSLATTRAFHTPASVPPSVCTPKAISCAAISPCSSATPSGALDGIATPHPQCLNQSRALTITGGSWFFKIFLSVPTRWSHLPVQSQNSAVQDYYLFLETFHIPAVLLPSLSSLFLCQPIRPHHIAMPLFTTFQLSLPFLLIVLHVFTASSILPSILSFCVHIYIYTHTHIHTYIHCSCNVSTTVSPLAVCLLLSLHL